MRFVVFMMLTWIQGGLYAHHILLPGISEPVDFEVQDDKVFIPKLPQAYRGSITIKVLASPYLKEINKTNCQRMHEHVTKLKDSDSFDLLKGSLSKNNKVRIQLSNYPIMVVSSLKEIILKKLQDDDESIGFVDLILPTGDPKLHVELEFRDDAIAKITGNSIKSETLTEVLQSQNLANDFIELHLVGVDISCDLLLGRATLTITWTFPRKDNAELDPIIVKGVYDNAK